MKPRRGIRAVSTVAGVAVALLIGAAALAAGRMASGAEEEGDAPAAMAREIPAEDHEVPPQGERTDGAPTNHVQEAPAAPAPDDDPCSGTVNPLDFGPACCAGKAVIRPQQDLCDYATVGMDRVGNPLSNLSPRINDIGIFDGARDRPNTLPVSSSTLQICAVYLADNGEGDGFPHGPYGNLHWDLFDVAEATRACEVEVATRGGSHVIHGQEPSYPLEISCDGASKRRLDSDRILRGPHRTHGDTDEWLDDEVLTYHDFGIFEWGARSQVILRVYESDSDRDDGGWGRRNDVLGMEFVDRAATEDPEGIWIPFHDYTNDHPRRRTGEVGMWMLLKTGGTCP